MPDIDPRAKRDRLARNPGGMVCEKCSEVFIGEEWHQFCALCVAEIAAKLHAAQNADERFLPYEPTTEEIGYTTLDPNENN
jgi:hypothetical protein